MTWIYKPKSVSSLDTLGLHSVYDSPASMPALSATSSENPTASLYYKHTSPADVSTTPLYGTTSKPLTDIPGEEQTSLLPDFPASHTVQQAREREPVTTETSGPIHSGSLAKWSPDTSCWRTYQVSMWAMLDGNLTGEPWSDSFPNWGTMRNGELIPLPTPEPHTTDAGGGSWHIPTPTAADHFKGDLTSSQHSDGSMHSMTLPDFVNRWPDDMFPTPSTMDHIERKGMRPSRAATNRTTGYLSEEAVMWATPTVNDSKNNAGPSERKRHGPSLNVQAANMWPTPMVGDAIGNRTSKGTDRPDEGGLLQAAKMWPTPKSTRSGPDYAREGRDGSGGDDLATSVAKEEHTWPTPSSASQGMGGTSGRFNKMQQLTDEGVITEEERRTMVQGSGGALNADWVEWLMGVPQGWSIAEPCADYDGWLQQQRAASHWLEEQGLPRTIVGQENRVNRLKMLGNGIVPSAAALAITELSARLL